MGLVIQAVSKSLEDGENIASLKTTNFCIF